MGIRPNTLLTAAGLAAATLAISAGPAAAAKPVTAVKVTSCTTGTTVADRSAVFRAGMRRVSGAKKLSVRFRLEERAGDATTYEAVDAPGIGVWRTSKTGVAAFTYSQRVKALAVGSSYRAVIDYRWQNAKGKVLKHAKRTSKVCKQGEALPNLTVRNVAAARVAGRPRLARYTVSVLNRGSAAAPASNLKLIVDGDTTARTSVPALVVGQLARVTFTAKRCQATMGGEVDPDGLVRESRETDNMRSETCPFG